MRKLSTDVLKFYLEIQSENVSENVFLTQYPTDIQNHVKNFTAWKSKQIEKKSDIDFLLDWMSVKGEKDYNLFLKLSSVLTQQGYQTNLHSPISEDEFKYRDLIKNFDKWMKKQDSIVEKTPAEYLLDWVLSDILARKEIVDHKQFLALAKVVDTHGYRTALDIPVSEKKFKELKKIAEKDKESVELKSHAPLLTSMLGLSYFLPSLSTSPLYQGSFVKIINDYLDKSFLNFNINTKPKSDNSHSFFKSARTSHQESVKPPLPIFRR